MNLCVGQKEIFPIVRGYLLWKTALSDWGGGSKEGWGSAGDTQGVGGDAASWLAGPPRPASPPHPGPSLLVLGLTGPLGPSLAAIPATRLCQYYNRSKLEKPGKSGSIRQTGGELLKSFRGHLC